MVFVAGLREITTLNLLIKLFIDTIGEVDADISGGVLLCGPAYLYNMLSTFAAMNSQEKGIFNTEQLLRTQSYYELSDDSKGNQELTSFPIHQTIFGHTLLQPVLMKSALSKRLSNAAT